MTKESNLVSVIIPTYNRAHLLRRSISSVLNQTHKSIECIVVDDCSTDNTEQLISSMSDDRIRYIRMPTNSGACAARNEGILAAKGDYIAFNDSDDVWKVNKIEVQLNAMESSGADICFCAMERHSLSGSVDVFPDIQTYNQSKFIAFGLILAQSLAGTPSIVAKKEVFGSCLFDTEMKCFQDWEWLINASCNASVYYISEPLVELYLQKDSITIRDFTNQYDGYLRILNKYRTEIDAHPKAHAELLEALAFFAVLTRNEAFDYLHQAFKLNHSPKTFAKMLFAKMGILESLYRRKMGEPY